MSENKIMFIECTSQPVVSHLFCACGEFTGTPCGTTIENERPASLIFMPHHLVASHEAAGNWGEYPHNGSEKILISQECSDYLLHTYVYPSEDAAKNPDSEEEKDFERYQEIGEGEEWSYEDTDPRGFGFLGVLSKPYIF